MSDSYICKIASPNEMKQKWDDEISRNTEDRENWIVWKEEALTGFREGKILPYYGILDGAVICEATAAIHPETVRHSDGLIDEHTAYLYAFRTNEPFRGKGFFSRLFAFMLDDLRNRGYRTVTLGVEPDDTKNKSIYRHYGFTRYIGTGTDTCPDGTVIQVEYYARELTENRQAVIRQDDTLAWYQENAEAFLASTGKVDMTALYRSFMELIPFGGHILDLGCGAGSASLYFTQHGYQVLAVDGCREMCEHTQRRAGCRVRHIRFEELDYTDVFDGIWACASLLHVSKSDLPGVFRLIRRALKCGGVLYASFKYGDSERVSNSRHFSDFTTDSLRVVLDETGGFLVEKLWLTNDARPGRTDERWVNVLCRAEKEA